MFVMIMILKMFIFNFFFCFVVVFLFLLWCNFKYLILKEKYLLNMFMYVLS